MHANPAFLQSAQLSKPAKKPRARLAAVDAVEIFKVRRTGVQATNLANMYGVSEKAIRDIWTARTWARETWHLEPSRQMVLKQAGRPKGRTDSRPRPTKPAGHSNRLFENQSWPLADTANIADAHSLCIAVPLDRAEDAGNDAAAFVLRSLDEQLGAWDLGACCPESSDPFERDWERARAALGMGVTPAAQAVSFGRNTH